MLLTKNKWLTTILAIITGIFLFMPSVALASGNSVPTNRVSEVQQVENIRQQVAPKVTTADLEGKIERGGSQIYGMIQTVVIYASYIGFAVGVLMLIFGFGRNGRMSGVTLMLTSSVAYFFIGYGPETVAWLGQWIESL